VACEVEASQAPALRSLPAGAHALTESRSPVSPLAASFSGRRVNGRNLNPSTVCSTLRQDRITFPTFVIKAVELPALDYIESAYPRPQALEWINRG
jgi:hypothetical protein